MSVMESLRGGTDSALVQGIVAAIVISFVGWGVGMSGSTTDKVASVNGEPIYGLEYGRALRIEEQRYSAQTSGGLSEDDRSELRERVLQRMIRERALVQQAVDLGLAVSNAEVAGELMEYTFLQDTDGKFDKRAYKNFLQRQGLTRGKFEEQLREQLLVRKLQELVVLGASVSETAVFQGWREQNTMLDLQMLRARPADIQDSIEVSDETVQTWLAEHPDEIKARYDNDFDRLYDLKETVDVRLVRQRVDGDETPADVKTAAAALRAEVVAGADAEVVATERSEDVSSSRGGLMEGVVVSAMPASAQEALAELEVGGVTDVIATPTDARFYVLLGREPAKTLAFDDVKADIAKTLYLEDEAPTVLVTVLEEEILPAWTATGEPPRELLDTYGLSVQTTGPIPSTGGRGMFSPPDDMMQAARRAEPEQVLPEVYEDGGAYFVGELISRTSPDESTFESQKDAIAERALLQKRIAFFEGYVDDVVAQANVSR